MRLFSLLMLIALAYPGSLISQQCQFTFTPINPCPGEEVTFTVTNPVSGAVYTWDLDGDNAQDDGKGTTVKFSYPYTSGPMVYTIQLYQDSVKCGQTQTISVKEGLQPTISVVSGGTLGANKVISACGASGNGSVSIVNTTPEANEITGYTVNWGDGSPVENYTNLTFNPNVPISHTYVGFGYRNITITATHQNGCALTNVYRYFRGGNPDIGLASIGNTVGLCAPTAIDFTVTNFQNNPSGTTYTFFKNNVQIGVVYTQDNLPNPFIFNHLFDKTSCGETTPDGAFNNAYSIKVVAFNPCGTKEAIIQPITLNSKPVVDFSITPPPQYCPNEVFVFKNTSTNINEVQSMGPNFTCIDSLPANWIITPGQLNVNYALEPSTPSLFNANELRVRFLTPGTYQVAMFLNPQPSCGPDTVFKSITILEPPKADASVAFSNPNGCAPLTATFTNKATGYQLSYNWSVSPATGWQFSGGTSATSTNPVMVFSTPGTYTVTLTASNVCSTSTWTQTVEVRTIPSITLPDLGPFCQTANVCFDATNTTFNNGNGNITAYNWSFPGGTPSTSSQQYPCASYTVTTTTTFQITASATNQCGTGTATTSVTIQVPTPLTMPANRTVCINAQPIQLSATPGGGTWSGPGVSSGGLFTPSNAGPAGIKELTYSLGTGVCTATGTFQINLVNLPTVNAGADLFACVSDTVLALGGTTPASGGSWSSSPPAVISGNTMNPAASGVNIYTLTYSFTDTSGCSNTDTRTVTVRALPPVTAENASFCNAPGLVPMPNATPPGGNWAGTGVTGNQFNPTLVGVGAHPVTYTYTDANGCTNTATATITVINPTALTLGPDTAFCVSAPPYDLSIGTSPSGGTWTTGTPGLSGSVFNPSQAGAGTYTFTYTFGSGNCAVTGQRTITVYPLPIVNAGADLFACVSDTALTLGGITPVSGGTWSSVPPAVISGNTMNPAASGVNTYTLTYSFTDTSGCTNTDTRTVTVRALPVVTAENATFCNAPGLVPMPNATPPGGNWAGTGVTGNQFNPTLVGVGSHPVTYTSTDANGCTNTATATITVINPTALTLGPDTAFCVSAPPYDLSIGTSPSGGTWTTGTPGLSGSVFNPSQAGAGTYTFTYTFGSGNCAVTGQRTITVYSLPIVTAGADASACVDVIALPLMPSPLMGTWSGPGVLNGDIFNPNASGAGTFPLTYSFTDTNGCTNTDGVVITVHPLPVVTSKDTVYCNTPGTVQLPTATPAGGNWMGQGINNNVFDPVAAGGVGTYAAIYTFEDNKGCTNRDTIQISVIDPDNVAAGPDTAFCVSVDAYDLSVAAAPAGGRWLTAGPGLSGSIFSPSAAGAGTYDLVYAVGTGNCEVRDTLRITVNGLPAVNAGADASACVDADTLLLSPAPDGGDWSGAGVFSGDIFNPAASGDGTFELTYTFTDGNGCINTDNVVITVHPLPMVAAADTVYCNTPGLVQLPTATPAGGNWAGPGISAGQFDPQGAGGVNTYAAVYTYTDDATMCTNRDTAQISVISPEQVAAGPDTAFCVSVDAYDLSVAAAPAGGRWLTTGPGLIGSIFSPSAAGAGTYDLVYAVGTGNCEVRDTLRITVNGLPAVNAGVDASACVDADTLLLSPAPDGGDWSGAGVFSGDIFNPAASGDGTFELTYTFTDGNGCVNTDNVVITIHPLPMVAAADTVYCNTPGIVQLPTATPAGGSWAGPGISAGQFDPQGAGGVNTYAAVYTYTDAATMCTNRDTANIDVIDPEMVYAGVDTAFCVSVSLYDLGQDAIPATGGTWSSSGGGLQGAVFSPQDAGAGLFTLIHSVGTGNCEVRDTALIRVWPLPVVDAGPDLSACATDSSISLGGSPVPGVWSSVPAAVIVDSTWNAAASGVDTFVLTYTHVDSNGCINTDQRTGVVHPLPTPTAGDTTYCNTPGSVALPVASPSGGTWSGQGVVGSAFDPIGAGGVGQYQLTYSYTDANLCTDSIAVAVDVIEPPFIYAGVNDTLCINGGVLQLLDFVPASGGTWLGSGIINASTGVFDPEVAGGGPHQLVYTLGNGNCQVWDTIEVYVIAVSIDAGPDRTSCLDDVPLSLADVKPLGGFWTGAGITDPAGIFNPMVAGVGTHTLFYQYNDPILGCGFRDSIDMIVFPMPGSAFADPVNSCINVEIPFINQSASTFMPVWYFGDGATSTLSNPTHMYTDTGTYTVTLVTRNQFGCMDSVSKAIFVTSPPTAFFEVEPDSGCAVLQVLFSNSSFGFETAYSWDFGNGQKSNLYDPGIIGFAQGTGDTVYHITLRAENLCAVREWSDSVKVFPWPQVAFGTSLDTICTGATLSFSNVTLGKPEFFFWDFGNGLTSTDTTPAPVTFLTDTSYITYTITLVATNFCGSDTATYPVVVKPVDVRAFFNVPNVEGCQPYTLTFTNFATLGAPVSWDFGDGNTSAEDSPTHTFTQAGTYRVVQQAASGCGFDTAQTFITVLPAPDLDFSAAPQVCRRDTLQILNTSPTPLSGTIWSFGTGDSSLLYNPRYSWALSGPYNIQMTGISAINGCPATISKPITVLALPQIAFTPSMPDGCVPLSVSFSNQSVGAAYFEWTFGDGNTLPGTAVQHTYTVPGQYAVRLQGVDLNGCRNDTVLYYVTAHPLPNPAFGIDRDRLCGLPVVAQMVNQTPDATGYVWDFGNGATSVQNNPAVTYSTAGDFNVRMIATNIFGCKDTTARVFSAYAIPDADFTWDPEEGCTPLTVAFTNLSANSTNAFWETSDGRTSTSYNAAFSFPLPGFYGATLIASHRDVCFDTLSMEDIVQVFQSPFANFTYEEILTMPPSGQVQFTDKSVDAVWWDWSFGDGGISQEQNPLYRYFYNGEKEVTLWVTAENGCKDDTTQVIPINFMKGLFVPNAFTPTAGVGDVTMFKPKGVGLRAYQIEVYSPYGQLLWQSSALDNGRPAEGWDGTFEGRLMPQDVYTWQVTIAVFDDGSVWPGNFDYGAGPGKRVGSVTLIR